MKLTPNDPVKVKEQIADLKMKLEDDAKRSKKGSIPEWLKARRKKREDQLKKLEDTLA